MATTLVDSPPAPASQGTPADGQAGAPPQFGGPEQQQSPAAGAHACATCGASMSPSQDWCLQCGASSPGSTGSPGWRSAAILLGATAALALGAAAAAYAAFHKSSHRPRTVTTTVAQAPAPVTTVPVTPGAIATTPTPKTALPKTAKPPKIPLTAPTPTPSSTTTTGSTTTPTTATGGSGNGEESQPAAILLDTNAAATYNPYSYEASAFGDPSLTIDGDPTTGWTAQVDAATAPKMAEGVLVNLKSHNKLSAVKLITSTPGMTVQLYGANSHNAPPSITDKAWIALSHEQVVKKRHVRIKLRHSDKAFSFITVWISKAPASSTAAAPGHVSVNELELFPAG